MLGFNKSSRLGKFTFFLLIILCKIKQENKSNMTYLFVNLNKSITLLIRKCITAVLFFGGLFNKLISLNI